MQQHLSLFTHYTHDIDLYNQYSDAKEILFGGNISCINNKQPNYTRILIS